MTRHTRTTRLRSLLAIAIVTGVAACGSGAVDDAGSAGTSTPSVSTPKSTVVPRDAGATSTVDAPNPAASSTAPPSPITVASTVPLPTPVPLPLDDETSEPVVPLGSVAIPAIGIESPLFEGIRLPTFGLGPGHWPGTAMPGQLGNMVIGGYRTEGHADFGDLDLLAPGNEVIVTDNAGARFTYLVESTEIIDPFASKMIYQTRATTATLFACHPKGSTDQRIIVHLTLAA